jgi:hypothetical protein
MKKDYVAPAVEELGLLHELTLGQSSGRSLDADFERGTLFSSLTFS